MKRYWYLALAVITMPVMALAQDANDALRYSQLTFGGTARSMAMGGAFSAIGDDMSTLTVNPAGLGVFVKSQLTLSPGITYQSTSSAFNGETSQGLESSANIQNAGMVLAWKNSHDDSKWKNLAFGLVYNRTNGFNYQINTQGNNGTSSLLDAYTTANNGVNWQALDHFYGGPAFNSGLLDTNKGGNTYFNIIRPFLAQGNYIVQQNSVSTSGSMGETDISLGGNYNNRLYVGVTVGIPSVNYTETAIYSETPAYTDTVFGLKGYSVTSNVQTSGTGVNLKVGVIYRVNNWIRAALAIHTPTAFQLTDQYNSNITANYNPSPYSGSGGPVPQSSPEGSYSYTLTTPMRAIAGLAFVIHNRGLLSVDYEYVNYSTANFSDGANSYSSVNQVIANSYMGASNIRVGGEWLIAPFSIRAGYAYYGNAYTKSAANTDMTRSFSAGAGVRIKHWFIDLAYVLSYYDNQEVLYTINNTPVQASNSTQLSNTVLTVGVNF